MSGKEKDLEIEDDLARGRLRDTSSLAFLAETALAQKIQRDYKAKISSQSKKNFVLEKDVRYLDSRIALLIQNRMALEEVCFPDTGRSLARLMIIFLDSKMKSPATLKMHPICRRGSSPTTKRRRNTAISFSCCSRNLDTLHTFVAWSQ